MAAVARGGAVVGLELAEGARLAGGVVRGASGPRGARQTGKGLGACVVHQGVSLGGGEVLGFCVECEGACRVDRELEADGTRSGSCGIVVGEAG